jgi:hypothetical protein
MSAPSRHSLRFAFSFLLPLTFSGVTAATADGPANAYADEAGFRERSRGLLERIARQPYGERSLSPSVCPDTGLPVRVWAVEGEEIISPYTGRRYRQGPTGYFGPKARDADGRISAFGGDPLKFDLPPVTARLLMDPTDARARAFLAIPGNLSQQYHFATSHWARLQGLLGDRLGEEFQGAFRRAVAGYADFRRPSDGAREHAPLEAPFTLVGRPEEHLGGGGTENHKIMFRTSALLFAQTFPPGSLISGRSPEDTRAIAGGALRDFARRLFVIGNGEYQSTTYFPHSLQALLNLHDFSPDPESRALARATIDYYLAVYALKVFNGVHTGPKRRGWVEGDRLGEMDTLLWLWAGGAPRYTTVPVDPADAHVSLHQLTTRYRPDPAIVALAAKQVPLPFEAELSHPDYGMREAGRHLETFYCSTSFALGSVQLDGVNNSGQQTTWSLNVRGTRGSLIFGGGQPRWLSPEGHSPYDQWVQKRGALLFMTGPTEAPPGTTASPTLERIDQLEGPRGYTRLTAFSGPLLPADPPEANDLPGLRRYFDGSRSSAATWLWVPRDAKVHAQGNRFVFEAPETWIVVTPLVAGAFWIDPDPTALAADTGGRHPLQRLRDYRVLVVPGTVAGFALEAVERADAPTLAALAGRGRLSLEGRTARYTSISGDRLELRYQPAALRPDALVNGERLIDRPWAGGGHYAGGPLSIRDGVLRLRTAAGGFDLDFRGESPRWTIVGR